MNVRESVEKLPDAIKRLILSDPAVRAGMLPGMELAEALSDPEWAEAWFRRCRDGAQLSVLRGVLRKYGANPFEPERLAARAEDEFGITGAEARVAIAKLRRSGIVFAVRKSWGDRLFYVPVDAVALWQPLLLPADNRPLDPDEIGEVVPNASRYRLPLSLELLSAWHALARQPIVRTAKGAPQQAAVDRLAKAVRLEPELLAGALPPYPYAEQLPPQAMPVLDLGLACGVLEERDGTIGVSDEGLREWLALSRREAERRLRELVIARYCSSEPSFHLSVSAVLALGGERWHTEGRIGEWQSRGEADKRLALLEAFGWIERGEWRGRTVIRRRPEPGALELQDDAFIVQPDGEILVPPEVGLRTRWSLHDLAEMTQADALCVYRLTPRSCEQAYRAGYSQREALDFLKRGSGVPVPEPVQAALRDWFASLGRTELLEEAWVLRTDGKQVADALAEDAELAPMLLERIGERHFLVDPACGKRVRARLRQIGWPAADAVQSPGGAKAGERAGSRSRKEDGEVAAHGPRGWIGSGPILSSFEADREVTGADELFPGLADIPSAWVTRQRKYHPTTSKELIRRAIQWQTAVRLEFNGEIRDFAPRGMRERGASWVAEGRWRPPAEGAEPLEGEPGAVFVREEDVAALMIVLPDLEELETD
ncbi:helicase-associated domain-containing protein [Cohnella cellulosilytica]|uniref:Helicase-associated domain-containing protein n=1 Tax=Cohnella cellulosilytica TaxID=986710 RepID=A0ABW2F7A9_9BACL